MRAGIDGHVWLHRSIFASPEKASLGELARVSIRYLTTHAAVLRDSGVQPTFIFDGADIPAKRSTEHDRGTGRGASLARAIALKESGEACYAKDHFAKAADISHLMVHDVIRGLRNHGFEAFVAPYEADAQLTFLAHSGKVDFVISEDSDLLVFGCSPILFKYDVRRKIGLEFAGSITDIPEFRGLSHDGCVTACILAGCDYGPSVPGIGLKRAVDLVSRAHGTRDSVNAMNSRVYDQLVLRGFKFGDRDAFVQALRVSQLVFRHQTVFDMELGSLRPLRDTHEAELISHDDQLQIGPLYDNRTARAVHMGIAQPDDPTRPAGESMAKWSARAPIEHHEVVHIGGTAYIA
jgi:exonuclease-1